MNSSFNWYNFLPKHFQPSKETTLEKLNKLKTEFYFTDENFALMVTITPWAVRRLQWFMYYSYKQKYKNLTEKELCKYVILSRMNIKETFNHHPDPKVRPITKDEIAYIKSNIDSIINNFKIFEDVVEYLVKIDKDEGQFNDPGGLNDRVNKILMEKENNFKDYQYF